MNLKITANVKSAVNGLKKISKESKKTKKSMDKMAKGLGGVGAAIAGLGLAVAIKTIKTAGIELAILGDRLAKQAKMVGVTAEQYQGFEFAAKRSGTSITAVANGLKKLGRVMVDARNGSRQMTETFAALGIELMKEDGTLRDVNDVFLDFADRSREMGASAERTGVTMLLLGRSGTELTNMMSQGAKGVTDMKDVLEELGAVMSEDFLQASEKLVDVQADLEHAFRGVKIGAGEELIPALSEAGEQITDMLGRMDAKAIGRFAESFVDLAMGVALATDHVLGFGLAQDKGFVSKHEADLRAQSRAMEDFAKRVNDGTTNAEDFIRVYRGLGPEVKVGSEEFQAAAGAYEDYLNSMSKAAGGQGAEFLSTSIKALTQAQIGEYKATLAVTGSMQDAEEEMVGWGTATENQAALLTQLVKSEIVLADSEKELSEIRKKLIADQRVASDAATKDALKRGLVVKQRVAALGAQREAKKAGDDADKAAAKERAEEDKALDRRTKSRLKRLADLINYQKELSLAALADLFQSGAILEGEFIARSKQAALEAADELRKEGLTILKLGRREKYLNAAEENAEIGALNRSLQADIQAASIETSQVISDQQRKEMDSIVKMVDAVGGMFSTLSSLAMEAYAAGDEEAKKAAVAMFHVSQAAALATAIVNTAAGVAASLKLGFPAGLIAGVTVGAAGAAQIATIIGTSIKGIGDAGITSDMLKSAGLNNHSAIVMRNDETLLDPVGTKHITEMLAMQKNQMQGGGGDQTIRTTVEIDGRVLGESVDTYMIRQRERGLQYSDRIRQEYV